MNIVFRKRDIRDYNLLSTILKTIDTSVSIAIFANSVTISKTFFEWLVTAVSKRIACCLALTNEALYGKIMNI